MHTAGLTRFVGAILIGVWIPWLSPVAGEYDGAPPQPPFFDTLAGPLPRILKALDHPYLVIADIDVPADKITTIEPGVVILFRNFTGLHVSGRMIAEGTKSMPIIFSSENDKTYNRGSMLMPNPYDWNGIYIHEGAFGTILSNCAVAYTVYGIISDTKYIKLDPVTFIENGKMNLMIEGKEQIVTKEPFKYVLSTRDATQEGVPVQLLKDPLEARRNAYRYGGIAALVAGLGAGIYYAVQFSESWERWKEINNHEVAIETGHSSPATWDRRKSNKNRDLALMCIGTSVGLAGGVFFTLSFTF
jgi:hypothetical protein